MPPSPPVSSASQALAHSVMADRTRKTSHRATAVTSYAESDATSALDAYTSSSSERSGRRRVVQRKDSMDLDVDSHADDESSDVESPSRKGAKRSARQKKGKSKRVKREKSASPQRSFLRLQTVEPTSTAVIEGGFSNRLDLTNPNSRWIFQPKSSFILNHPIQSTQEQQKIAPWRDAYGNIREDLRAHDSDFFSDSAYSSDSDHYSKASKSNQKKLVSTRFQLVKHEPGPFGTKFLKDHHTKKGKLNQQTYEAALKQYNDTAIAEITPTMRGKLPPSAALVEAETYTKAELSELDPREREVFENSPTLNRLRLKQGIKVPFFSKGNFFMSVAGFISKTPEAAQPHIEKYGDIATEYAGATHNPNETFWTYGRLGNWSAFTNYSFNWGKLKGIPWPKDWNRNGETGQYIDSISTLRNKKTGKLIPLEQADLVLTNLAKAEGEVRITGGKTALKGMRNYIKQLFAKKPTIKSEPHSDTEMIDRATERSRSNSLSSLSSAKIISEPEGFMTGMHSRRGSSLKRKGKGAAVVISDDSPFSSPSPSPTHDSDSESEDLKFDSDTDEVMDKRGRSRTRETEREKQRLKQIKIDVAKARQLWEAEQDWTDSGGRPVGYSLSLSPSRKRFLGRTPSIRKRRGKTPPRIIKTRPSQYVGQEAENLDDQGRYQLKHYLNLEEQKKIWLEQKALWEVAGKPSDLSQFVGWTDQKGRAIQFDPALNPTKERYIGRSESVIPKRGKTPPPKLPARKPRRVSAKTNEEMTPQERYNEEQNKKIDLQRDSWNAEKDWHTKDSWPIPYNRKYPPNKERYAQRSESVQAYRPQESEIDAEEFNKLPAYKQEIILRKKQKDLWKAEKTWLTKDGWPIPYIAKFQPTKERYAQRSQSIQAYRPKDAAPSNARPIVHSRPSILRAMSPSKLSDKQRYKLQHQVALENQKTLWEAKEPWTTRHGWSIPYAANNWPTKKRYDEDTESIKKFDPNASDSSSDPASSTKQKKRDTQEVRK